MRSKIPRILLGIVFLTAGINGFYRFLPDQTYSERGIELLQSLKEMGYLWSLVNAVEIFAGTLLIFNVMGQFGVLMLVPICLGILFFHSFFSPEGSLFGWIAIALELTMLFVWRDHFIRMFKTDSTPAEMKDFDWDEEDSAEKTEVERLHGAGTRSVSNHKDVEYNQEQEMIADRPTPSRPVPSTLDQNI